MNSKEFTFEYKNTSFYGEYWKKANSKAVVVIAHGLGEHLGRFKFPISKFIENDFSVVAFDHFGHGKTTGKRGHNPGYSYVLESVSLVINKTKELFKDTPVFLYGHSMGGNVVVNYALQSSSELKGIIATSPFLRLAFTPPKWKLFMGNLLRKIAPSITLGNEIDASFISRDKEEVEKYVNDPLVHAKVSPNYSLVFIDKGEEAIKGASKLQYPMLLLHGTDDKLIDHKATIEFGDKTNNATVKLFDGGYHELHNDLCKEEMMQEVINWLVLQLQK